MTLSRRSLLLGAMAAPAIVRAESLMKLWVPPAPPARSVWVGPPVEWEWGVSSRPVMNYGSEMIDHWGVSLLEMSGEPPRQAARNAVLRLRLMAVLGTHRPAAVCEQLTGPVRAVVHA